MTRDGAPSVDILIPVYNEGRNIGAVLGALRHAVRTPFRVLICYDHDGDDTLEPIKAPEWQDMTIIPVKNQGRGVHAAILTGFRQSEASAVLVFPADDTYNVGMLDTMFDRWRAGAEIVAASRFMPGGSMVGCPWVKNALVRISAYTLRHFAAVPTHDPTNGFRLFSRRVLDTIPIESTQGFTYSLELLVKVTRLGWPVAEVPAQWFERKHGRSRFKVFKWAPAYLRWYLYAFATVVLRRGSRTVRLKPLNHP
jgi:dolichol-phosphate mannosyltransferase